MILRRVCESANNDDAQHCGITDGFILVVSTLAARIQRELDSVRQCSVYEFELIRTWPLNEKDREAKIAQFAKGHGFRLRFYRMGWCAIFDRAR